MEQSKTPSLLQYAVKKATKNHFFLAEYLSKYRSVHEMDEDGLARFLGCDLELLPKLALCRRPDPESPSFRSDVERVAVAFAIQPDLLAQLIREIEFVRALAKAKSLKKEAPSGFLAAARDKNDNEPEPDDKTGLSKDEEERT